MAKRGTERARPRVTWRRQWVSGPAAICGDWLKPQEPPTDTGNPSQSLPTLQSVSHKAAGLEQVGEVPRRSSFRG